ncbi:hypothetical protein [Candidatus Pelagadaptatus aseana]
MAETVFLGGLGMAISMGGIVVLAAIAGTLCFVLEKKLESGREH